MNSRNIVPQYPEVDKRIMVSWICSQGAFTAIWLGSLVEVITEFMNQADELRLDLVYIRFEAVQS